MARIKSYELRWNPKLQQGAVRLDADADPNADLTIQFTSAAEGALIAAILASERAEVRPDGIIGFTTKP